MKIFLFIFGLLLIVFLQIAFLPFFALYQAIPNLILAVIISWCILKSLNCAFALAFLGGIALDFYSGTLFGIHALSLVCVVLIAYLITQYFLNKDDLFSKLGIIILATLAHQFTFLGFGFLTKILKLQNFTLSLSDQYFSFLFWQVLVNAGALFLVFPIVRISHNFLFKAQKR